MNIAIIGKIGCGFLLLGGGTSAMIIVALQTKYINILAISETVSDDVFPAQNIDTSNKNYQCKFNNEFYDCTISSKDFNTTTKHLNISTMTENASNTTINKEDLKTSKKIYRIKVDSKIGDWSAGSQKIEIVPKTDNTKKYASLKPLLALNENNKPDQYTKTQYILVKTKNPVVATPETVTGTTHEYKCLTSEKTISNDASISDVCIISDFSNSTDTNPWNELNFKKPENSSVEMLAEKYYLVKLKDPTETQKIKHIKIKKSDQFISLDDEIIPTIYNTEISDKIFIFGIPTPKQS